MSQPRGDPGQYWSKSSVRKPHWERHEAKLRNQHEAVMKHQMWKLNNRKRKKKKVSDFEMRLEMTLQKKKLRKKELEKKYYDYKFKPKTNKRKNLAGQRNTKRKIRNHWKQHKQAKGAKPAKRKPIIPARPVARQVDLKEQIEEHIYADDASNRFENEEDDESGEDKMWSKQGRMRTSREQIEDREADLNSEEEPSEGEFAEIEQLLQFKKNKPKFKRFSSRQRKLEKRGRQESEKSLDDESKLIDMEDEEDIPDQLEIKYRFGYRR